MFSFLAAAFLLLHRGSIGQMKVVPITLVGPFVGVLTWSALQSLSGIVFKSLDDALTLQLVAACAAALVYLIVLRKWARDKAMAQELLLNFSVRNAICTVESDRLMVYSNIATLVQAVKCEGSTGIVNLEEVSDAFDQVVQLELQPAFHSAFGWCSFEYYHYVLLGFLMTGTTALDYIAIIPFSDTPEFHIAGAAIWTHWSVVTFPAVFAAADWLMSQNMRWSGWKQVLWMTAVYLCGCAAVVGYQRFALLVQEKADESRIAFAIAFALLITSVLATTCLFIRTWGQARRTGAKAKATKTSHEAARAGAQAARESAKIAPPKWQEPSDDGEMEWVYDVDSQT